MATKPDLDWSDEPPQPGRLGGKGFSGKLWGKGLWRKLRLARWGGLSVLLIVAAVVVYYLIGMAVIHRIADDVDFTVESAAGESRSAETESARPEGWRYEGKGKERATRFTE